MKIKLKFVPAEEIPKRNQRSKKYADLYAALRKKPGAWAEIDRKTKATFSGRSEKGRTYPDVRTIKRGDRYFAAYVPTATKRKAAKR